MEKVKKYLYKSILLVLLIFIAYATCCSVFNIYKPHERLMPIIIILGVIVSMFFFLFLKKKINKINERTSNILAVVICVVFFILMSLFGYLLGTIPSSDIVYLRNEAHLMMENGGVFETEDYFSRYSYQTPVAILVYFIYRTGSLFHVENLTVFGTVVNALFIAITAAFTYLTIKKAKDHKTALITLLFFVLNPIFYLYSSYFYTDTLCMPFAAIAMYLFVLGIKNDKKSSTIILLGTSGLLLAIGTKIRAVLCIALVAMIMSIWFKNKICKKSIINVGTLIIGFLIGWCLCTIIALPFKTPNIERCKLPSTYWVMMGLNEESDGKYIASDRAYVETQELYKDKCYLTLDEIKNRICNFGVTGLINFERKKVSVNWSNGDYDYVQKLTNVKKINGLYKYTVGNKNIFVLYYAQICKAFLMVIFLLAIIKDLYKKDIDENNSYVFISMIGAFVFYLLWEVAARYSLTFLPWMILLFGSGLEGVEHLLNIYEIKTRDKTIRIGSFKKILAALTVACSLLLMIINFNKYTIEKREYQDVTVLQYRKNKEESISNQTIEQTFKSAEPFDTISLKFIKGRDKSTITHYVFRLYDDSNDIIYEKDFTSKDIKNNTYKSFSFSKVKPSKETEYTIRIASDDANKENSLKILMFNMTKCDLYPNGNMKIDNNEKGDLVFRVTNNNKRAYTTKSTYILLCIVIIIIELFAFYKAIKDKIKEDKNEV